MMKALVQPILIWIYILVLSNISASSGSNSSYTSRTNTIAEDDEFFSQPMADLQVSADAPVITSSSRTTDAFSYVLSWKPNANLSEIKCYKIRFRKEGDELWTYQTVEANATQLVLNNLDSTSLYEVEMIRLSRDNSTSQLAMSSFRTGASKRKVQNASAGKSSVFPLFPTDRGKKSNKSIVAQVPGAPSNPFVTVTSATSVSLTWLPRSNGGSPITGYKVQMRAGKKKNKWKTIASSLRADTKSHDISGLKRDISYKFRVIAINAIGESPPSQAAIRKADPNPDLSFPPMIRDVESQNGSILIHWTYEDVDPKKIQGFIIKYVAGTKRKRRKIKDPTASTFEITSPVHAVKYSIVIQAYNAKETFPESHPISFSVQRDHAQKKDIIKFTGSHEGSQLETHDPNQNYPVNPKDDPDHNANVKKKSSQRDLAFIIGGSVLFFVIGVLLISCIFYHKQKKKGRRKRRPGNLEKQPETLCTKLFGATCLRKEEEEAPPVAPPSPPRCSCYSGTSSPMRANGSRLTSNRTSISHNVAPENGVIPCSRTPGNMYAVYYDYHPGRPPPPCLATPGVPLCWVRGEGEFCHIIPHNTRPKMIEEPNLSGTGSLRTGTSGSRTPASNSTPSRDPEVNPEQVHLIENNPQNSEGT